jgi:2-polyprenyl-3-methyl-5-hydroxy-6-metoxy-1,4-benzoquinol methylase
MRGITQRLMSPLIRRLVSLVSRQKKPGAEQPAEFYDRNFHKRGHWKLHYTRSHYYPLWTVIAERVRQIDAKRILDIGCGPGQVACLLRDRGVPGYKGLDFSPARLARARKVCPEFEFVAADVFQDDNLEVYPYDCVVMMEFLEHIERDLDILRRVRPGTTVLATVPNFPAAGHVRHFADTRAVETRYRSLFERLSVTALLADQRGTTYFILQGTR